MKTLIAVEKFLLANSRWRFFKRYQALTESTSADPMIQDATHVWSNRGRNDGVFTTAPKFVMNAWLPHSVMWVVNPCGVCIHELAIRIHRALKCAPNTTRKVASSHILGPSRSPPNSIRPRNPPSRANANTPSAASRLPNTLPTNREYCDQFIPNANSWTSPVAMPIANTSP